MDNKQEINFNELINKPEYLSYLEKGKYKILQEQKYYIDIPWIIANRKAAPLTIGQGLMFNCDNDDTQDWIEEWYEKNYVYSKLYQNESLILSKTLDIYKIYLKLGIFLIYGGK